MEIATSVSSPTKRYRTALSRLRKRSNMLRNLLLGYLPARENARGGKREPVRKALTTLYPRRRPVRWNLDRMLLPLLRRLPEVIALCAVFAVHCVVVAV